MKSAANKSFVMIGSGNLATALTEALRLQNFVLKQEYSYNHKNARAFAKKFNCEALSSIKKISADADYYFICVKDDKIKDVALQLHVNNKMVVHCSGSVAMEALAGSSKNYGVFYPLSTFSGSDRADFRAM